MTNGKTTKRALFSSIVALMLCFSMLLGTTFAWFTDSAVSGNNIIKTGNLDMKLSYKPYGASNTTWTEVKDDSVIFGKDALYEPGYTEAIWLQVENLGSLAFRYDLAINVASEKPGINKAGKEFKLSDYLDVKYMTTTSTDMESNFYTTRESLDSFNFGGVANSGVTSLKDDIAVIKNGVAFSADDTENGDYSSAYVLVVISMPETVDNEANHNGTDIPEINFTLTAVATQLAYEKDSFGSDYDTDSEYPDAIVYDYVVSTVDELKAAFAEGGNILLNDDLSITETLDVPAGKEVLLNLNGKTISMPDGQNVNTVPALFKVKMGDTADGPVGKLIIEGDGTVDVGNNGAAAIFPGGDVIINGGTFIRDLTGIDFENEAYPLISGYNQNKYPNNNLGTLVINGGYFDSGYYNTEADKLFNNFEETHAAGQGQSSDTNAIRLAVKDNMTALINESNFKAGEGFVVTGGTFVGANPAWGDEGCMLPSDYNGNYLRPWSYYQGGFIPGQVFNKNDIVLPDGYSITEGTTATGIPTYTVNYNK